ncbi:unnamed protein product, partial [Durusdinium trenchii]
TRRLPIPEPQWFLDRLWQIGCFRCRDLNASCQLGSSVDPTKADLQHVFCFKHGPWRLHFSFCRDAETSEGPGDFTFPFAETLRRRDLLRPWRIQLSFCRDAQTS